MKSSRKLLLSFSAPLLVLLATLGFFQRKGNERVQAIPAFFIGSSFILSSFLGHQLRRKKLLHDLKESHDAEN